MNLNYALCFSRLEKNDFSRNEFFKLFEPVSSKLLVSQEFHSDMYKVHYHIYIKAKKQVKLEAKFEVLCFILMNFLIKLNRIDVKEILKNNNIFFETFYFESCDDVKGYLLYITKEDFKFMYKNLSLDQFNFNFIVAKWAEKSDKFNMDDNFVKSNLSKLEEIKFRYYEIKQILSEKYPLFPFGIKKYFKNWRDFVIQWFNSFFKSSDDLVKPLYLYGNSNCGKTYFINGIFSQWFKQNFIPNLFDINFTWSDWNPNLYNLVVIDQFRSSKFNKTDLINIIKQDRLKCQEKITGKKKIVLIKCPMIFISNYEPDKELIEHLTIVKADENGKDEIFNWYCLKKYLYLDFDSNEKFSF